MKLETAYIFLSILLGSSIIANTQFGIILFTILTAFLIILDLTSIGDE